MRSGLCDEPDEQEVYRRMRLTLRVNDHEAPRNVGLLFFSDDPARWFRGARIEVVQFAADRAGDVQEERSFGGALADQLRDCLHYLENLSTFHLRKQRDRSRVRGWVGYPMRALRETLVNAVYHRGYDVDQPEPTKVHLFPGRVEVTSYPGPVAGIEPQHLLPNAPVRSVPARNRRIGEFLKELGLAEGRLSGLPKVFQAMEDNGSPPPRFDFDEQRTFFCGTPGLRTGTSSARETPCMPTRGRCTTSRRPSSGWRRKPTGGASATRTAGSSPRRRPCWSASCNWMRRRSATPGRGVTWPAPGAACGRRCGRSRRPTRGPGTCCRTRGGSSRNCRSSGRRGSE